MSWTFSKMSSKCCGLWWVEGRGAWWLGQGGWTWWGRGVGRGVVLWSIGGVIVAAAAVVAVAVVAIVALVGVCHRR